MSVSKIRHDDIPLSGAGPVQPVLPTRENLIPFPKSAPDSGEFWAELNRTLDDFFTTINASKEHIKRLANRLTESDNRNEFLAAENAALREQLESHFDRPPSAPSPLPAPRTPDVNAVTPIDNTPLETRARRSIWSRLSGLDPITDHDDDIRL